MPKCVQCGAYTKKVRRTPWERLICGSAYQCQECKRRYRFMNLRWSATFRFIFSRYTVCVKCGRPDVHGFHRRDPIVDRSWHPLSLIQQVVFAPRRHCPYCRLQYFDVRRVAPHTRRDSRIPQNAN